VRVIAAVQQYARRRRRAGPLALPLDFLQSGHSSSSINGQPCSDAKGEPLREVAQI